jgi:hypothetical protein
VTRLVGFGGNAGIQNTNELGGDFMVKPFLTGGKNGLIQLACLTGFFKEIGQNVKLGIDGTPGFTGSFKFGQHSDDSVCIKA